jgi:lysophospholipase L1-like esterase
VRRALSSGLVSGLLVFALAGCSRRESTKAPPPTVSAPPSSAAADAAPAPAPAPAGTTAFVGRFDLSDPAAARFAWSGSKIVGRFKGTAISARLKDERGKNYFQVLIDGEPQKILHTDARKESYVLAEGLPDGTHEVALYRRTEAEFGETSFLGFVTTGEMLAAPPPAERRIEIIGDSITAGYGNEGAGPYCVRNPSEENQYTTYGAIAARALHAEHVTIAYSGKTIGEMTDFYERILPARPESKWDFTRWVPQLVVINLGTNNFATYDPTEARYVRIYANLFDRIRKAYPEAFIVCLLGPMLTDIYPAGKQNLTLARRYTKATEDKLKASGATRFAFVEVPEQKHADGLGCSFHPSVKTHQRMAERLVAIAHENLGW